MFRNRIRLLLLGTTLAIAIALAWALQLKLGSRGPGDRAPTLGEILVLVLPAMLVLGVLGDFYIRRLFRPLDALGGAVRKISQGDLTATLAVDGPEDIAALSRGVNQMLDTLRQQEAVYKKADALQNEASDREEHDILIQILKEQLSKVTDVDLLLHSLLNSSLEFSKCEAGSIWVADQNQLVLWYTRNLVLEGRKPGSRLGIVNARIPISSKSIAGHSVLEKKQVVIDDVYNLPPGSPFQFDQSFDQKTGFRTRCMISIPLIGAQGAALGVMQLINPAGHKTVTGTPLAARTESFALLAGLVLERARNAKEFLMRMVRTVEIRDPHETGVHVQSVSDVACHLYKLLADKRHMPPNQRDQNISILRVAALLHDIGKVGIPDSILKKPGKLDEEEFNLMKWHTVIGAKLFDGAESELEKAAADVARYHHERWDGTGYPGPIQMDSVGGILEQLKGVKHQARGLKGEETPLFARLVAIADVYDALASHRAYKEPWTDDKILEAIREGAGKHFDPEIAEVFLENFADLKSIRERF
ncbi:MAG: HD domain-containing protein [Planctomycetes bacterium]|nr:HD domain-containing protein [Planctomycetota bacterium]